MTKPSFNAELHNLLSFIVKRCPPFATFNPGEILVLVKKDRGKGRGILATCASTRVGNREIFIRIQGIKTRYLVTIFFPRFFNLKAFERLETVIHELFHVSGSFDGKLGSLKHGKVFDEKVTNLARYIMTQFPEIMDLPVLSMPGESFSYFRFKKPGPRFGQARIWTETELVEATEIG